MYPDSSLRNFGHSGGWYMKIRSMFSILFVICSLIPVFAQEEEVFGIILYADGDEMSIFRQGELLSYDLLLDDVIGLPLLSGDMVQTEQGSSVEIQIMPSQSIIKVAENTTFQIGDLGTGGGADFELLYGRVRARVSRLTGDEQFQIRGRSAIAGVRGTDFGFDYITRIGSNLAPSTSVYCFEGSVAVAGDEQSLEQIGGLLDGSAVDGSQSVSDPTSDRAVLISANQMVDIVSGISEPSVEEQYQAKAINNEITNYWERNKFNAVAIDPKNMEEVFPGIKAALLLAQQQAALAAEKRAFLASGGALKDFRQSQTTQPQIVQEQPSVHYDPVSGVGVPDLINSIQSTAYVPNGRRVIGSVLGTLGVLSETAGIIITLWGDDLGVDADQSFGTALMVTGGINISIGILSLVMDNK